jgi:hypothetical protein
LRGLRSPHVMKDQACAVPNRRPRNDGASACGGGSSSRSYPCIRGPRGALPPLSPPRLRIPIARRKLTLFCLVCFYPFHLILPITVSIPANLFQGCRILSRPAK